MINFLLLKNTTKFIIVILCVLCIIYNTTNSLNRQIDCVVSHTTSEPHQMKAYVPFLYIRVPAKHLKS
jgi:hypothetical protein